MKKKWYQGASYIYEMTPHNNDYEANLHYITFHFPNTTYGKKKFKAVLYAPKYKNELAELLQGYIDEGFGNA